MKIRILDRILVAVAGLLMLACAAAAAAQLFFQKDVVGWAANLLTNEKYKGDARLQKTYTVDYLTKRRVKNDGQVEQYYVRNSHKAIIPRAEWEAVQMELQRRAQYCKEVGIRRYGFRQ